MTAKMSERSYLRARIQLAAIVLPPIAAAIYWFRFWALLVIPAGVVLLLVVTLIIVGVSTPALDSDDPEKRRKAVLRLNDTSVLEKLAISAKRNDVRGWASERLCSIRGHAWERCKCSTCKEVKGIGDAAHTWHGCICEVCHSRKPVNDAQHSWGDGICRVCNLHNSPKLIAEGWHFAGETSTVVVDLDTGRTVFSSGICIVGRCIRRLDESTILARCYSLTEPQGETGKVSVYDIREIISAADLVEELREIRKGDDGLTRFLQY
jgi:hypothetical protein